MTTLAPHRAGALAAPAADPTPVARDEPGLTVVAAPTEALFVGAPLVRRGPALALVSAGADPVAAGAALAGVGLLPRHIDELARRREADLERALGATTAAGFAVRAWESVPPEGLRERLRGLADEDVACAIVAGDTARRVRSLARWLRAPVLAIPPRAASAAGPGGARRARRARHDPRARRDARKRGGGRGDAADTTPTHADAHGGAPAARAAPGGARRAAPLGRAGRRRAPADLALALAVEHGLEVEPLMATDADAVLTAARSRDGLVVVADDDGWRPPSLLRAALRERRPVVLVPAT
jgi:hypothetical protein